jgi:hypothetical protein
MIIVCKEAVVFTSAKGLVKSQIEPKAFQTIIPAILVSDLLDL